MRALMKSRPLYQRVADALLREIAQGRRRPGGRLPTEDELIQAHQVSRITVRQALEQLRQRGLIERFPGRGSFVSRAPGTAVWSLETVEDVARAGAQTDMTVLSWALRRPTPLARRRLATGQQPVYQLRGVRSTDGIPLYYEEIWLPAAVGRKLHRDDLERATVLELVQHKLGWPLIRGVEEISAEVMDRALARRLRASERAPTLILDLTYFGADDRPLVYVRAWYRADRFTRRNELRRAPGLAAPIA